jgi:Leucine-rich repeat (LRR) protein
MSKLFKALILAIFYCLAQVSCIHLNKSNLFSIFNYSVNSEFIDLSNQQIESIDVLTFTDLKQLKLLHLENNQLTRIEIGHFKGLSQLREIWLESNSLISIDRNAFVGLNNLELVCMYDNPISNLFPSLLQPLCDSNTRCNLKIKEKCVQPLSI